MKTGNILIGAVKAKSKSKSNKIKISFINELGYKKIKYVTPEQLKLLSRVIDITIE